VIGGIAYLLMTLVTIVLMFYVFWEDEFVMELLDSGLGCINLAYFGAIFAALSPITLWLFIVAGLVKWSKDGNYIEYLSGDYTKSFEEQVRNIAKQELLQ
jgi:hypothetical protein